MAFPHQGPGPASTAGAISSTTAYGPFGDKRVTTGTDDPPFSFQSDVTDADTGLVDMGTRLYDPVVARFTTRDVVFGTPDIPVSMNQFVYAGDNPVTLDDPTGMCMYDCFGTVYNGNASHGNGGRKTSTNPNYAPAPSGPSWWKPTTSPATPPHPAKPPLPFLVDEYLFGLWPPPGGFPYQPVAGDIGGTRQMGDPDGSCSGPINAPRSCAVHDYGYDPIRGGAFGTDVAAKEAARRHMDKLLRSNFFTECTSGRFHISIACAVDAQMSYVAVRIAGGGVVHEPACDIDNSCPRPTGILCLPWPAPCQAPFGEERWEA